MPIAKEQLKVGFVVVANPGGYVSKDAVKQYGWEKLVDDGPDPSAGTAAEQTPDAAAQQRKASKAS